MKEKLYTIVFGTETPMGKRFDVWLLWTIMLSVLVVMIESIPELGREYSKTFYYIEWAFTLAFTAEYLLRLWISPRPLLYVISIWGLIDLLSVLPTYLSIFLEGYHYLLIVRIFRLLRVFRILKLVRFNTEANVLLSALQSSRHKIGIFLFAVLAIVTFLGTIMYVVEGGEEGFVSIPQSIYWAIVTITTVGYGDMVPHTVIGKLISSVAMIIGYAIIAVPTGIVTAEMTRSVMEKRSCPNCSKTCGKNDKYCSECGQELVS